MKGTQLGSKGRRRAVRAGIGTAIATLALSAGAETASADKYKVTNTEPSGPGSLVAAIQQSRKSHGGDKITFAKNLRGKIDLPDVLTLKGKVTIVGNDYGTPGGRGFRRLTLSGHRGESDIRVEHGSASLRDLYTKGVSLKAHDSKLTVKNSFIDGQGTSDAVGVSSRSTDGLALRILRSTVQGFDLGVSASNEARIDRSTIADNVGGGGIAVGDEADISNSTITGNVVDSGYTIAGGGIDAYGGSARVTNSTITHNQAIGGGSAGAACSGTST